MKKSQLLAGVIFYTLILMNTAIANASTIDWSTVTLSGTFPNFSFSDASLGTVSLTYSNDSEVFGISNTFASTSTLDLGNTGGETLTMSWSNAITSLDLQIWDIDALPATTGEEVTFSSSATISVTSLHPTDIWNPTTLTLSSDGSATDNSQAGNFTVMNFADINGFTSITFDWVLGGGTGRMGIGEFTAIQAVPVPAAVWLFGSGLLGIISIARRKAA